MIERIDHLLLVHTYLEVNLEFINKNILIQTNTQNSEFRNNAIFS